MGVVVLRNSDAKASGVHFLPHADGAGTLPGRDGQRLRPGAHNIPEEGFLELGGSTSERMDTSGQVRLQQALLGLQILCYRLLWF